ncbi:metallopeptidase [Candidatus Pacearchaeota archaeon]|nr:metallopeptidase [Candidatus Pacearchaeota archaeon]
MPIKYKEAQDIRRIACELVKTLKLEHIQLDNVGFLRSHGSSSRGTIARCHALSKPLQLGMNRKAFYTIEMISEKFDKMPEDEKIKVIIHELMHIPKSFGGGFKHHDFVSRRNVEKMFEIFRNSK